MFFRQIYADWVSRLIYVKIWGEINVVAYCSLFLLKIEYSLLRENKKMKKKMQGGIPTVPIICTMHKKGLVINRAHEGGSECRAPTWNFAMSGVNLGMRLSVSAWSGVLSVMSGYQIWVSARVSGVGRH